MRRNKTGRTINPNTRNPTDKSSRPPRGKEDENPSILAAGGLIFMALCLSALSSGLQTAKDLTTQSETAKDKKNGNDNSKTTIDPKKGQANNSGAEENSNATTTPKATPPSPNNTSSSFIQRFFAIWANSTPTKEKETKTSRGVKIEDSKDPKERRGGVPFEREKPLLRRGFTPIPPTPDQFEKPEISPELAKKINKNNKFREKALEEDLQSHTLAFADQNKRQNLALRSAQPPKAPCNPRHRRRALTGIKVGDTGGKIGQYLREEGLLRNENGGNYGHVPPPKSHGR